MAGRTGWLVAAILLAAAPAAWTAEAPDPASEVNPFIGTGGDGNVFPGAVYPAGLIQWSPDNDRNPGGYKDHSHTIRGFSLTHFSGRGVAGWLDVPFMPVLGPLTVSPGTHWLDYASSFSHENESASPGAYRVKLDRQGIGVELSVTARTGLGEFTYPASPAATLLINTGGSRNPDDPLATGLEIVGDRWVQGAAKSQISGVPYRVYFAAEFQRPFSSFGVWNGDLLTPGGRKSDGAQSGAYVTFDATREAVVRMKVGVSFVSIRNARDNLRRENRGWDLAAVKQAAHDAWNRALRQVEIEGGSSQDRAVFYTSFYHALIHPNVWNDANGQYLGFDGKSHRIDRGHPHYENITTWDGWRNQIALLAITMPAEAADIIRSLLTDAAQDPGHGLPRWQQSNSNSGGMVGDGPLIYVATANAYGDRGFDTLRGLADMERDASVVGTRSGRHPVRSGLADYLSKGYVPGQASVTEEYCNDDFALSRLELAMGHADRAATYLAHAQNWKNLFDKDAGGYIVPRRPDGTFEPDFKPSGGKGFVEGSSATYTWMLPFDFRALFAAMGGNDAVIARLDQHFTKLNAGGEYAWMGNEPEATAPWAYDFAGAPYRTQDVVRRIRQELFTDRVDGIPGNDDSGAMGSWYVFAAMGLFPEIPGVPGFVVGSPLFPTIRLHLPSGKVLVIRAAGASADRPYVQSLTVNGRAWNSPWIPWERVARGGTVEFGLSDTPNKEWGAAPDAAPPSFDMPVSVR